MNCDQNRLQGDQQKQCRQESKHQLQPWPGRSSFISGELKGRGDIICFYLTGALLCPPQKTTLDRKVHFRDQYTIDVFHLSFNFLCLVLLQICISMKNTLYSTETFNIRFYAGSESILTLRSCIGPTVSISQKIPGKKPFFTPRHKSFKLKKI